MALKRKAVFLCLLVLSPACSGFKCQTNKVFRVEEGDQLSLTCMVAHGWGRRVTWKRSLNGNSTTLGHCDYWSDWSCDSLGPYEVRVQQGKTATLNISEDLLSNIAGRVTCEQSQLRGSTYKEGYVESCIIQVQYPAAKIRNCQAQRDTGGSLSGSCDVDKLYSSDVTYGCWWIHVENGLWVWGRTSYTQPIGDGKLQCSFHEYRLSGEFSSASFFLAIRRGNAWYKPVPIHFETGPQTIRPSTDRGSTTRPTTERGFTTRPAVITGTTSFIPWPPTTPSTTNGDEQDGSTPTALIAGVITVTLLVIVIVVIAVIVVIVKRRKGSQKGNARSTDRGASHRNVVADSVEYVSDLRVGTVEFNPTHRLPPPSRGPNLPTNHNASSVPRDVDDLNLQSQPGTSRDLSICQDVDTGLYTTVDGEGKASPPPQAPSPQPQVGDAYAVVMKPKPGGNPQPNNNSNNKTLNQSPPGTSHKLSTNEDVEMGLYSSVDGEDKTSPPQAPSPEPQAENVYAVVKKPKPGGNPQPNNNSNSQALNQSPTPNLSSTPDPDEAKGENCPAEETYAQVKKKKKTRKTKKNSQGSNLAVLKEAEGEGQLYAQVKKPKRGATKSTDEGVPGKPVSSDPVSSDPGMSDVRARTEGTGADYENVTPQDQGRPSNEVTSTADVHDVYNALNFHRPPPTMESSDDLETQYSHIGAVNKTG